MLEEGPLITLPASGLTQDDIKNYNLNGYLIREALLTDEEVEEIQHDITKLARGDYNTPQIPQAEGLRREGCLFLADLKT